MLRFAFFALAIPIGCLAGVPKEGFICPDGKRHYRSTVRHIESGGIGYEKGYTTLEAFLASDPSRWAVTPFLDARAHVFDNGKWAANAGIGLRTLRGNRAYGINSYYDYRNKGRFHSNQIGVGLETLGQLYDFRINGYLPVGKKISSPYDDAFRRFSGNYMFVSQKFQSAMKGADAELGVHFGKSERFDFYAAAGPYYFIGEKAPATWGGKARISGTFKDILTLEISDSYDSTFHNKFQGQISLNYSFGPKSKVKEKGRTCNVANTLTDRMLQPVYRQEIIVIDKVKKTTVAIDPLTGLPYFFVFVNNMSSSNGTYESPYPTLAQAQANSAPNDIIYVFPGDGTTKGMDAGIFLQASQRFWGSGVNHSLLTTAGIISIPAQSNSSPTITNTDINTEGNAITLATNNAISGFTIASAMNDAIFGTDPQSLDVSFCTFENTNTFPIQATFPSNAFISITNNQFLNNANGVFLTINGTSTLICSNNTFMGQISPSNMPLEISAINNIFSAQIGNNIFNGNATGSVRFNFDTVQEATIHLLNNTMTNSGTGSLSTLGSSFVILATGTTDKCAISVNGNTFSDNTLNGSSSNSVYLDTQGAITNLEMQMSSNTISNNGGAGLVLATPVEFLTLLARNNTIAECNDNGIAIISSTPTATGTITIENNTITDIANASNGIAISQGFTNLDLTISNNAIDGCSGSGILCFSNEFTNMTANITDNVVSNCQNLSGNAASGLSLDTFVNLNSTIADNTFTNDAIPSVAVGFFTSGNPNVCLTLTGNASNTDPSYSLTNLSGVFNLSPCNVDSVNVGMISSSGTITPVQSCPSAVPCPP